MMIRAIIICLGLLGVSATHFFAQELAGVIKDKNQKGVPYVNIGIPAKAFGIITDDNGNFKLKITSEKETDTIQITSIGYYPLVMSVGDFKKSCLTNTPIVITEEVYQLATTVVRPDEYETKVLGTTSVADLECVNLSGLKQKDSASVRRYKEKGISEKSGGVEIGNKISIKKGQQTFIDRIQFKTCLGPNDTAIYRINIYSEGKTVKRVLTPIGMVKVINSNNELKEPIVVKTIGKIEVHDLDVSKQNIQVTDDFIIALECIYASNSQMNIGAKPAMFGSTDLLIRESIMDEWIKVPLINMTFIAATVTYKKKSKK
ncbi:MAG: carboxypeptidase-like regulatory domain-containing protein [Bacteroidetes bacterium]|nr:carboxypeptidase-like regulatory domain-containing protein [Bacteroidota bacterium]